MISRRMIEDKEVVLQNGDIKVVHREEIEAEAVPHKDLEDPDPDLIHENEKERKGNDRNRRMKRKENEKRNLRKTKNWIQKMLRSQKRTH